MSDPVKITVRSSEAAAMLGISERLLRLLSDEGAIPKVNLGDHRITLYSVDALRIWALEASGYTREKEVRADGETVIGTAEAVPAKGRPMVRCHPGRPRKPRASRTPLPLRSFQG